LCRNVLEELSIRASIALGQKRVNLDIVNGGQDVEALEKELSAASAQVVSIRHDNVAPLYTCS
jgi:hypothetical protein